MSKFGETASFLKAWAVNKPVVWVDTETKARFPEQYSRREYWQLFKPHWWRILATTNAQCGCRKRFGLWPVVTCSTHLPAEFRLDEDEDAEDLSDAQGNEGGSP